MVHLKPPLCSEGACVMPVCPGVAPLLPPELVSSLCSEPLMLTLPHSLPFALQVHTGPRVGLLVGGLSCLPLRGLPICFSQCVP